VKVIFKECFVWWTMARGLLQNKIPKISSKIIQDFLTRNYNLKDDPSQSFCCWCFKILPSIHEVHLDAYNSFRFLKLSDPVSLPQLMHAWHHCCIRKLESLKAGKQFSPHNNIIMITVTITIVLTGTAWLAQPNNSDLY